MNPIEYLVKVHGFKISSDPSKYESGVWGLRKYMQYDPINKYWIHQDEYCDGFHNAFDLYREDGAPLPAVVDGYIVEGTKTQKQGGNFGGTVVLADKKGDYQYIFGHCKNIQVKVGDEVKQGDILAYQSNTNYYGVYMDSHLHFQTQIQKYYANEKEFVKTGIDPTKIDVNDYVEKKSTSSKTSTPAKTNTYTVKKGDTLYSIAKANKITVDELKKLNNLKSNTIHIGDKLKVKASPVKPQATTTNTTPRTIGSWKTNKINGAQYIQAVGTFTVGDEPIMSRWDNPIVGNNQAGWIKAGTKIKYNYLVRANGYVWIQYEVKGRQRFVPFNTWNSKTGAVGKNGEWGTFS